VKQRGGDLHKMYSINNLTQDPQRMITVDRGVIQTGGSYKKHKHSRKYLKHGGSGINYSMINNAVYKAMTPLIANNQSTIQTNIRAPAMV
jgi:hypothetical protein